jgi:hypothetical protein
MTNWGDWQPKAELFEEAGVLYSRQQAPGLRLHAYTLVHLHSHVRIPRHVYVDGSIDTLLQHWNRASKEWRVTR